MSVSLMRKARNSFEQHAVNVETVLQLRFCFVQTNAHHHVCACWSSDCDCDCVCWRSDCDCDCDCGDDCDCVCWSSYCDCADDCDYGYGFGAALQQSSMSLQLLTIPKKYSTHMATIVPSSLSQ